MDQGLRRSTRLARRKRQKTAEHCYDEYGDSSGEESSGDNPDVDEGDSGGESAAVVDGRATQSRGAPDCRAGTPDPDEEHGTFAASVFSQLKTYTGKRSYFERFVAKVDHKGYARTIAGGGCMMLKEKTLVAEFRDCLVDGKSFIQRWLKDPNKRTVHRVSYDPGPLGSVAPCDATTLNPVPRFCARAGRTAGPRPYQRPDSALEVRWETTLRRRHRQIQAARAIPGAPRAVPRRAYEHFVCLRRCQARDVQDHVLLPRHGDPWRAQLHRDEQHPRGRGHRQASTSTRVQAAVRPRRGH